MTKLLSVLMAGTFAAALIPAAFAQSQDDVAAACKGKKASEEVIVDGKTVKCPAPKK